MLREESVEVTSTWAPEEANASYRQIDRQLRSIAKQRAGLDVEEARWLREAEKQRVWRKLGFSTALEYLEDVFGYAPRTAMERLRVAKELAELCGLEREMREGNMSWSAAKELSRVMTRANEAAWLARARGKNLRDIEEMVAGHAKGDDPDAPKNPDLMKRKLVVELSPRVDALMQQCRMLAADEIGQHIEDAELVELLCRRFLEPAPASDASVVPPRPSHRIVSFRCDDCGRAWQEGRGKHIPLDPDELARAECDAELVEDGKTTKAIPQRIRKQVWARDKGRCRVPGCRATRCLDIHHMIPRAHGGDHDPANLVVLCSGHHQLLHAGRLTITGRAPDLHFARDGNPIGEARSRFAEVVEHEQAKRALVDLGYKAGAAREAVRDAAAHVDADADVAMLVKTALARGSVTTDETDRVTKATQALTRLGFKAAASRRAAEQACEHVGDEATLEALIKEALRLCNT